MAYAAAAVAEARGRSIWPTSDATRDASRARVLVSSPATPSLGCASTARSPLAGVPGVRRRAPLADVHCKTAAVDAEVDGRHGSPLGGSHRPQPRLAPRDRAVVGHVVVQSQERQQRAQDALSRPRRVPVGELAIGESESDGQTLARAETRLVLPPIPDTGGRLDVLPLGARDTRHAGPRISGWRAMIDRDRELCTKAPTLCNNGLQEQDRTRG